jgi:hypothetical protein
MSDIKTIPQVVLDLLKTPWVGSKGYSAFESHFREDDRSTDPSYYIFHSDRPDERAFFGEGLSWREAKALVDAQVFGQLAVIHPRSIAVNEHVEHALKDFCNEVYDAWNRYQERLTEAERICPVPETTAD